MLTINYQVFQKKIFQKGVFRQFCASPYFGSSAIHNRAVIISNQVDEPRYVTFRKRKDAFIIPYQEELSIGETLKLYFKEIQMFSGCLAPFYTFTDLDDSKVIFRLQEPIKKRGLLSI